MIVIHKWTIYCLFQYYCITIIFALSYSVWDNYFNLFYNEGFRGNIRYSSSVWKYRYSGIFLWGLILVFWLKTDFCGSKFCFLIDIAQTPPMTINFQKLNFMEWLCIMKNTKIRPHENIPPYGISLLYLWKSNVFCYLAWKPLKFSNVPSLDTIFHWLLYRKQLNSELHTVVFNVWKFLPQFSQAWLHMIVNQKWDCRTV